MNLLDILTAIGIPSIIGGLIYIGTRLQILNDLKKTSDTMKGNLKVIGDHLTKYDTQFDPKELQSMSPLQLTDEGRNLIEQIGFDTIVEQHRDDFCDFIDNEKPRLKYDVELAAIKAVMALSDKEYMSPVKVFMYNNPNRTLNNLAPTLGVYVRDIYLESHPEITE